ncbi:hypothetical protein D3C75_809780 [compost metagenome]
MCEQSGDSAAAPLFRPGGHTGNAAHGNRFSADVHLHGQQHQLCFQPLFPVAAPVLSGNQRGGPFHQILRRQSVLEREGRKPCVFFPFMLLHLANFSHNLILLYNCHNIGATRASVQSTQWLWHIVYYSFPQYPRLRLLRGGEQQWVLLQVVVP